MGANTLGLKVVMLFVLAIASFLGASIPLLSSPNFLNGPAIPVLCALSAGVMLGVSLMHLLPESDELLSEAVGNYRVAFLLCGVGAMLVLAVEQLAVALLSNWKASELGIHGSRGTSHNVAEKVPSSPPAEPHQLEAPEDDVERAQASNAVEVVDSSVVESDCASVVHHHELELLDELTKTTALKDLIFLFSLELSVTIHSVILGVDFGLEGDWGTLVPLAIALCFHQAIEGIAMGSAMASLKERISTFKIFTFMGMFASTISIGIFVGICISLSNNGQPNDFVKGAFGALAAGSLLYVCLSEQVTTYFGKREVRKQAWLKTAMIAAFGVGFSCMAVLAIWE